MSGLDIGELHFDIVGSGNGEGVVETCDLSPAVVVYDTSSLHGIEDKLHGGSDVVGVSPRVGAVPAEDVVALADLLRVGQLGEYQALGFLLQLRPAVLVGAVGSDNLVERWEAAVDRER